ncbi:MAG: hypothetical protein AAB426_12145 [Myxococcota bacterium]
MTTRRYLALPLLSLLAGSCNDSPSSWRSILECGAPESDPTFCCDPATYRPIDAAYLASVPTSQLGERVALRGASTQQLGLPGSSPCICTDELCSCPGQLTLDAQGCEGILVPVPLGGNYGGQAVGCYDTGCWPLTAGLAYAVCGRWEQNPTAIGTTDAGASLYWLAVESFCIAE